MPRRCPGPATSEAGMHTMCARARSRANRLERRATGRVPPRGRVGNLTAGVADTRRRQRRKLPPPTPEDPGQAVAMSDARRLEAHAQAELEEYWNAQRRRLNEILSGHATAEPGEVADLVESLKTRRAWRAVE